MKDSLYLRLYIHLRTKILQGDYRCGEKLPSKRVLAEEQGMSVITVSHALELLCEEGYAEARERRGYFCIYRAEDGFAAVTEKEEQTTAQNAVSQREGLSYAVMTRTARYVLSQYKEALVQKSDKNGMRLLRSAIAEYFARNRGVHVEPERILIGSGAEYLYDIMIRLLGRDRIYGIENPSYEKIRQVYRGNEASCELLSMGKDGVLSSALAETGASVLHITPYHSFPTGITASASKRREYLRWTENGDRYLIEDDYESEFTLSGRVEEPLLSLDKRGRVIYINTFTRTVSPAIRVAYGVLPAELLSEYEEKLGYLTCPVPVFEQLLVAELLRRGDFERHINRVRREMRRRAEREQENR